MRRFFVHSTACREAEGLSNATFALSNWSQTQDCHFKFDQKWLFHQNSYTVHDNRTIRYYFMVVGVK